MKQTTLSKVKDNAALKLSKRGVTWVMQQKKKGKSTITSEKGRTRTFPSLTKCFVNK